MQNAYSSPPAGNGAGRAVYTGAAWTSNFTYRARLYNRSSVAERRAGLVFNYVDEQHFAEVLFSTTGAAELRVANGSGEPSVVATGSFEFSTQDRWSTVQVLRADDRVTVTLHNGADYAVVFDQVKLPAAEPGRIGFVNDRSLVAFDDAAVTTLPAPWWTLDVGPVAKAGAATIESGAYQLIGSGAGLRATTDEFRFVYQTIAGDGSITVRLAELGPMAAHGGAAVIMRAGLDAQAQFVGIGVAANGEVTLARREAAGGAVEHSALAPAAVPQWLRLTRVGDAFHVAHSADGVAWTSGGTRSVSLPVALEVGLVVASNASPSPAAATFDQVAAAAAPQVAIASPAAGSTVSGTATLTSEITGGAPIAGVQYFLDGAPLGGEVTAAPYSIAWDTTGTTTAPHLLSVTVRDTAGNVVAAPSIGVLVDNQPLAPTHRMPANLLSDFTGDQAPDWVTAAGAWRAANGTYATDASGGASVALHDGASRWQGGYSLRLGVRPQTPGAGAKVGAVFNHVDAGNYYKVLLAGDGTAQLLKRIGGGPEQIVATGAYFGYYTGVGSAPWIDCEVQRIGATTLVRANGSRLFAPVALDELGAGTIGLVAEGTAAAFDNVSVTSTPSVAYQEKFDTPPHGWSGGWQAAAGAYRKSAAGPREIALYTRATWLTDYTLRASVAADAVTASGRVGVVFNYLDAANYGEVLLRGDGQAEINKVVYGSATAQGTTAYVTAGVGRWNEVTILRRGGKTTVNVNGRRVFTDIAQDDLAIGHVGLVAIDEAGARCDELTVTDGLDPYKQTFPKIAGVFIGSQPWNTLTPAGQSPRERAAKHDAILVNTWRLWGGGEGGAAPAMQAIKNLNPAIVIGSYTAPIETGDSGALLEPEVVAKLNAGPGPNFIGDWWARDVNGNKTSQFPSVFMTNVTHFVHPDADGRRFSQWYAEWYNQHKFAVVPQFDLMYSDGVTMTAPRQIVAGYNHPDWNRDGVTDAWSQNLSSLGNLHFRTGLATYFMRFAQLRPTLLQIGNVGGQAGYGIPVKPLATAEYQYLMNAALFEAPMGKSWSEETWAGWHVMMAGYRSLLDNTRWPNLVWFQARGWNTGLPAWQPNGTPQQGQPFPGGHAYMRHALASALMENGYFCWSGDAYNVDSSTHYGWFDEFNLQLGYAVDAPVRTPTWTSGPAAGAFMRRFQNGAVIVNPRQEPVTRANRPAVTIDLTGQGYRRFVGQQDPVTNDGSVVTTITLAPGDGIVLLRD